MTVPNSSEIVKMFPYLRKEDPVQNLSDVNTVPDLPVKEISGSGLEHGLGHLSTFSLLCEQNEIDKVLNYL